jgi:GNAT superfamily N-acetyltransferase
MIEIRQADPSTDLEVVERLWIEYLTWGNDGLEERHGFRLPVRETVDHDLRSIAKFGPPDGRLLLAFHDDMGMGTASMQRIAQGTAEIKRMFVQPAHRRAGAGRRMLDEIISAADSAGYERLRLDSPRFMTAAHGLYRSRGFTEIPPYAESEIPDEYKPHWIFMELRLA